jgi:hypothetical protein
MVMHVWANPPGTPFALQQSRVRFAVGTPTSSSSNSWRVWTRGLDTYIACRDAYREVKVSLHASGRWRLGFTEKAVTDRPYLLPPGADRVWKKWEPDTSDPTKVIVALLIPLLANSLFVLPTDRLNWSSSVVFIEPPLESTRMSVISVGVAPTRSPVAADPEMEGGVVAVLPLGELRSVQLPAHYDDAEPMRKVILDAAPRAVAALGGPGKLPERGILFLHGDRENGIPWLTAVPIQRKRRGVGLGTPA